MHQHTNAHATAHTRHFTLAAIGARPAALTFALLVVLLPGITFASGLLAGTSAKAAAWQSALSAAICLLTWGVLVLGSRRRQLAMDGDTLRVRSTFYRRDVPLSALDLAHARVIDREEHPDLRPARKRNGIAIPGVYNSGHFTLRNQQRAFVSVARGRWRLWLPVRQAPGLLLEVDDPRALLALLRQRAGAPPLAGPGHSG